MAQDQDIKSENSTDARSGEKPTIIVLVRHGNTPTTGKLLPGRARGLQLSDDGEGQANTTAMKLSQLSDIAAIYSSPLERAQQTAAPLGKILDKPIETTELLYECDFGSWTGKELKDLYKLPEWQQVQKSPSTFRFPDGESFMDMSLRMSHFVEMAVSNHREQIIVAYSHADPIKVLLCSALGMHLDMFQRLSVATCSISAIAYSSSGPVVLGSNWQENFSIKVS